MTDTRSHDRHMITRQTHRSHDLMTDRSHDLMTDSFLNEVTMTTEQEVIPDLSSHRFSSEEFKQPDLKVLVNDTVPLHADEEKTTKESFNFFLKRRGGPESD